MEDYVQCWAGLNFFKEPPGPGFRSFSDTPPNFFILILQLTRGGFKKQLKFFPPSFKLMVFRHSKRFSDFSKAVFKQSVSKVLSFQS